MLPRSWSGEKKVKIENDEQRWIFFKYERLPNFYYQCGKLGDGENVPIVPVAEEKVYQYGACLRGELGRRFMHGWIGTNWWRRYSPVLQPS